MLPRRHVVIAVIGLLLAAGGLVWVERQSVTGDESTSFSKPSFVERLIPESGSGILSQDRIGIDLTVDYDATLTINGTEISEEVATIDGNGLHKVPEIGLVEYQPGPGKTIESLRKGQKNNVIAMVWKRSDGRSTAQPVAWTFQVT